MNRIYVRHAARYKHWCPDFGLTVIGWKKIMQVRCVIEK